MIGLSILLVIYMFVSLIYTELIFKGVSYEAESKKIDTQKTIYQIIQNILANEELWGKVKIEMSAKRETSESFYVEKSRTIQLSDADGTAQAIGAAIHECGHAIQYNKSDAAFKIIKIRDALKKFYLLDIVSPLAVLFFAAFCTPLYIASCFFMVKLVARVIVEFLVEADANLRILKYIKRHIPNPEDRIIVRKFLIVCSLTYLSTIS